jgi:hypothetical protein
LEGIDSNYTRKPRFLKSRHFFSPFYILLISFKIILLMLLHSPGHIMGDRRSIRGSVPGHLTPAEEKAMSAVTEAGSWFSS